MSGKIRPEKPKLVARIKTTAKKINNTIRNSIIKKVPEKIKAFTAKKPDLYSSAEIEKMLTPQPIREKEYPWENGDMEIRIKRLHQHALNVRAKFEEDMKDIESLQTLKSNTFYSDQLSDIITKKEVADFEGVYQLHMMFNSMIKSKKDNKQLIDSFKGLRFTQYQSLLQSMFGNSENRIKLPENLTAGKLAKFVPVYTKGLDLAAYILYGDKKAGIHPGMENECNEIISNFFGKVDSPSGYWKLYLKYGVTKTTLSTLNAMFKTFEAADTWMMVKWDLDSENPKKLPLFIYDNVTGKIEQGIDFLSDKVKGRLYKEKDLFSPD